MATRYCRLSAERAAAHARHRNLGIVLGAMGTTEPLNVRAPLRLVVAETSDRPVAQSDSSAAEQTAREQTDIREIDESQKALTERLRDRYWSW